MILLQQMLVLFLIMLLGYICFKKGYITQEASKTLSFIVVNIANPAMILSGSVNNSGNIHGEELLLTVVIAIVMYAVLLILGGIVPFLLRVPKKDVGIYRVMTIFSNIGFMGFPVLQAMYGSDSLLYAALFLFPYNILIYTYGISAMTKTEKVDKRETLKKVLNVGVLACIAAIILYALPVDMPVFVKTTISSLSNLTAPLSMLVIGVSLAQIRLKDLFTDVRLLIFSVIKLLLIPFVGICVTQQFVHQPTILGVCLIMLATPVGSMTAMLAQQYDGDSELASRGVALTTILSVVTIPLVFAVLRQIGCQL